MFRKFSWSFADNFFERTDIFEANEYFFQKLE